MQSKERGDGAGVDFLHVAAQDAGRRTIHNNLSLAFPPADIAAQTVESITPACIGMLGVSGTLPFHYTDIAAHGREEISGFFDLISAPAVRSFVAAWRQARPEYPSGRALPARGPAPAAPTARSLGERLTARLGVAVRVEQFAGAWEVLPPEQCCALGGAGAQCGASAMLGERLWKLDVVVRLHVGPLPRHRALEFFPGGAGAAALSERWAASGARDMPAEVRIHLAPGAAQGAALGEGAQLGHDSFVMGMPSASARDDLRYSIGHHPSAKETQ